MSPSPAFLPPSGPWSVSLAPPSSHAPPVGSSSRRRGPPCSTKPAGPWPRRPPPPRRSPLSKGCDGGHCPLASCKPRACFLTFPGCWPVTGARIRASSCGCSRLARPTWGACWASTTWTSFSARGPATPFPGRCRSASPALHLSLYAALSSPLAPRTSSACVLSPKLHWSATRLAGGCGHSRTWHCARRAWNRAMPSRSTTRPRCLTSSKLA